MRKAKRSIILGSAAGLLMLAVWLSLITACVFVPHGFYQLRFLIFLVGASSFATGYYVYEYVERHEPRPPFRLDGDLPERTNSRIGETNKAVRCPRCDAPMVKRLAKRGTNSGDIFFGCSNFPKCLGTRSMEDAIW